MDNHISIRVSVYIQELEAEIERLREALRAIERGLDVFVEGDYTYRFIRPYRDLARSALEESDGPARD